MKILSSFIFRALTAMLVGFLLVFYTDETRTMLIKIIGGLFALSGIIAISVYFSSKQKQDSKVRPVFPIVGIGSLAFGIVLILGAEQWKDLLRFILGGLLTLVGLTQAFSLIAYRRVAPLTWQFFVLPALIIILGCLNLANIFELDTAFTIMGASFFCYGVGEFFYGIRLHKFQKKMDAEQVQFEEIKDDATDGGTPNVPEKV